MKECPIHRCTISRIDVHSKCDECGVMMKASIKITDDPDGTTPVMGCKQCGTSYAILLNVATSITFPDTKLMRL